MTMNDAVAIILTICIKLLDAVRDIARSCDDTYGSRRMKQALNASGYSISRWKTRKLMREALVTVRHRKEYKVTTDSNHPLPVFENQLNRQFDVANRIKFMFAISPTSGYRKADCIWQS